MGHRYCRDGSFGVDVKCQQWSEQAANPEPTDRRNSAGGRGGHENDEVSNHRDVIQDRPRE